MEEEYILQIFFIIIIIILASLFVVRVWLLTTTGKDLFEKKSKKMEVIR